MHTAVLVHPMVKRVQEEVAEILAGPCLDGQYFTGGCYGRVVSGLWTSSCGGRWRWKKVAPIVVAEIC